MTLSREITKTEKMLIGLLAVIIVGVIYFFFVFTPVNNRISEIESILVTTEDEILTLEGQQTLMISMEDAIKKAQAEPKVIEAPDYDNVKNVVAMLNGIMAGTEGYTITFEALKDKELEGAVIRRNGKISFLCDNYAQAKDVINKLYAGPYRCQISDMTIRANGTGAGQSQDDVTISKNDVQVDMMITYYEVKLANTVEANSATAS